MFMTRKKGALSCPAFLKLEKAGAPFYICLGFLKSNSLECHNSAAQGLTISADEEALLEARVSAIEGR